MTGTAIAAAFSVATAVAVLTATWAWRGRRRIRTAGSLTAALTAIGLWTASDGLARLAASPAVEAVLHVVQYTAINAAMAALVCVAWSVAEPTWRPTRTTVTRFAAAPAVILALVATNPWHRAFLVPSGPDAASAWEFGPLFWVHAAYCYGLFLVGLGRLARAWWRASWVFRKPIGFSILATLLPVPLNVVALSLPADLRGVDGTPFFFLVTALLFAYVIARQARRRVVPLARSQIVEALEDAVLVLDHCGRLVDANPAADTLLRRLEPALPAGVLGLPAEAVLTDPRLRTLAAGEGQQTLEAAEGLHLDVRCRLQQDSRGAVLARVVTARDVSESVVADRRLREQLSTIQALQERLSEDAIRDALTGLHNRRHLMSVLETTLAERRPVALVILDVDHFKSVNDTHGHQTGDEVLCAVAQSLRAGTRDGDTVARYGGEEFVVLLDAADRDTALRRAEELRAGCSTRPVPVPLPCRSPESGSLPGATGHGISITVTLSAGVGVFPADGADARSLIAAADAALYAAKAGGRDRLVLAG
ncbi:diguanylate cyclase (GGDEF)-like protein [Kineococcus xinjiangensis]|uniref:Diguanylate cyclase (GGDEF)-like protein n=1 Tax=Kineococcus xinjiangensis TaxID=512762 RepID=A0A2S6IW58_9ACTN|nr:diguanylate cyclase [Kineococcus xinjiangensis]PPK98391.1 diguanylate cyclase (GGDEF)-like protein [Kineococcus xinjiangensis]